MTPEELNKACEWLKWNAQPKYIYIEDGQPWIDNAQLVNDFRKAMTDKANPLFEKCLANVNPETQSKVRGNMEYLQSKIDLHTKYMQEHGITSEQQLAILDEMRGKSEIPTNPWHKSSEELPMYDMSVIVAYDSNTDVCCFNHRSNNPMVKTTQHDWCEIGYDSEPTHWMYIPEIKED